ncbi:hypothetical protein XFEB_02352 [Xylella fastidiosa EB92.1]|nr:hypothetical protein XFEB_02352 [Xylella fastidiosa EB92.1]
MFITPPFLSVHATGTDDSYNLDAIIFKVHCVRHQQQQAPTGHSDGLPTLLPIFDTVLFRHCKRVVEGKRSFIEPDAVLTEVAFRLLVVPLEISFHASIVSSFCIYKKEIQI